ncbi:MAG: prolyl-tRNA synthetase associated domain-containing protein [Rhodospirillaceae bacterium]
MDGDTPMTPARLLARLDALGIRSSTIEHPPAFTVEEGEKVMGHLPGVHIKNLFLCDAKEIMWLVVAPWDRVIDLKRLPAVIGSARISFGSANRLNRVLGVQPGSVTPFAVINDKQHQVRVVLDAWMMTQDIINAHPLINTMTTSLKSADLLKFFEATGHQPRLVNLES